MHSPTPQDIARFLNGEVEDPDEWRRIAEAIDRDPRVRGWYELLNLERLLPDDEIEEDDSPEFAAFQSMIKRTIESRRSAELWLLHNDGPLGNLTKTDFDSISGHFVHQVKGEAHSVPFRIQRSAQDASEYVLTANDWPAGYRPMGLRLGKFVFWEFEPWDEHYKLKATRPAADIDEGGTRFGNAQTRSFSLSASDGEKSDAAESGPRDRGQFQQFLHESRSQLEVRATLPAGLESEFVTSELSDADHPHKFVTQRRTILLDFKCTDGQLKGTTRFYRPSIAVAANARITIRPLAADDLPLLNPDQLTEFLARQEFVALPIEEVNGSFRFHIRRDAQWQAVADPDTCWCLEVAAIGKEG